MEIINVLYFFLFEHLIGMIIVCFVLLYNWVWRIPVTVYRYVGDRKHPVLLHRKARLKTENGVVKLYVKKYKYPIKNFKAEYYYPGEKNAQGALALFEFKPGWLTPLVPELKDVPEEYRAEMQTLIDKMNARGIVKFDFDNKLYQELVQKAVDDTDIEWFLLQIERINTQYVSGWRDFLSKYGGHIMVALVAVCLLVGWIVWLEKYPEMAGQCINAGVEAAKNTYLQEIAGKVSSGASVIPPG